jgi:hypothetical protein
LKLNFSQKAISQFGIVAALAVTGDQSKRNSLNTASVHETERLPVSVEKIPELAPSDVTMAAAPTPRESDAAAEKLIRGSFLSGDYANADRLVREQLADLSLSDGYREWLKGQLPIIRLGWAWALIRAKNCDES